ncbi:MAG: TetR/AcrR family transcriptional regulator [Actinobacteria bacterium]|nr:TetR/AcrR family transcriptional regulator [Actinomycetota bacterium]
MDTAERLLEAAKSRLLAGGYADLSTRKVAAEAGVPLSQIHYHFGSRKGLVLALLERENGLLIARQQALFRQVIPLWQRYEQACDFLEQDLASGYVRILQEMVAAGWSDDSIAARVRTAIDGWRRTLAEVVDRDLGNGPLSPAQLGDLVCFTFLGAESVLLLERDDEQARARVMRALRAVGGVIRAVEEDEG